MKKQKMISTIMIAVFVIVCALGISIVMLLIAHKDVGLAFSKLAQGAVGNKMNFARTVRMMAWHGCSPSQSTASPCFSSDPPPTACTIHFFNRDFAADTK